MLTRYDAQNFANDLELPVFEAKGIKFGVVICHDTSFVEPALYLRWCGARLLFNPHFDDIAPEGFPTSSHKVSCWEHRTMVLNNQAALATLLKMVVVRSNVIIVNANQLGSEIAISGTWMGCWWPRVRPLSSVRYGGVRLRVFLEEHGLIVATCPSGLWK
jgi:predicted amidohydrolase